ncbi:MAG: DUF3131 domain-containing protein [Candidatus Bathyarchaeia archaeon]
MVKYKRIRSLLCLSFVSLQASLEAEGKKGFFRQNRWRFSKKAKGLIVFAIITVMLVSFFAFLPRGNQSTPRTSITPQSSDSPTASPSATPQGTNNQPGKSNPASGVGQFIGDLAGSIAQAFVPPKTNLIESNQPVNSSVWWAVAEDAWQEFQTGKGVDFNTGLPYPYFTDWDLGVYIQAVIDAQQIGLINANGTWGAYDRLNKVLTWLETRELNATTNYPYWFYEGIDGKDYLAMSDLSMETVDVVDTGRLFVALNNLRTYDPSFALRVNNLVYNVYDNRSDYAALVPSIESDSLTSTSIYAYYIYSGFASFWPVNLSNAPSTILNNIFSAGNVSTYGVSLPKAAITGDPLLCSVFELNNTDSRLMALANQVYLATETCYNVTGQYRAFSEGPSPSGQWAYEWVVYPDGRTWVVLNEDGSDFNISPVIYTKVAISFLAIYNTTFATNMVVNLENALPEPSNGYYDGVDASGTVLNTVGLNTNGLIIDAATYAIQNNP